MEIPNALKVQQTGFLVFLGKQSQPADNWAQARATAVTMLMDAKHPRVRIMQFATIQGIVSHSRCLLNVEPGGEWRGDQITKAPVTWEVTSQFLSLIKPSALL